MPTTQYIGSRYVPIFADPVEWSSTKKYEPLTIVTHEGNSYTSRQFVPVGIDISNERFWALTGNYNAQVEQYRRETAQAIENCHEYTDAAVTQVDEWLTDAQGKYGVKPFAFGTTRNMQESYSLLYVGAICHTNGFYASGDGGAAWYLISDTGPENNTGMGMDVLTCGNLFAYLIIDDIVKVDTIGAHGDGSTDDTRYFKRAIEIANEKLPIYLSAKTYLIHDTVYNMPAATEGTIFIEGAVPSSNMLLGKATPKYEKGTVILYTNLSNGFIQGANNSTSKLTGYIKNICFVGNSLSHTSIFKNIYLSGFKFTDNCGRFVIPFDNVQFYGVGLIQKNTFYNCKMFFKGLLVDSKISYNYISGNDSSDAICFSFADCSHSIINNNFFDFFRHVYTGYATDIQSKNNRYEICGNVFCYTESTLSGKTIKVSSDGDSFGVLSRAYLSANNPNLTPEIEGAFVSNNYVNLSISNAQITSEIGYLLHIPSDVPAYPAIAISNISIINLHFEIATADPYSIINIESTYKAADANQRFWIVTDLPPKIVTELPAVINGSPNVWKGMKVFMNGALYVLTTAWKEI